MQRGVDIHIKKPAGLFHAKDGKKLGLWVLLFQILCDFPRIGNNRAVIFDDRHTILVGESQLVFITKPNWYSGIIQVLIA